MRLCHRTLKIKKSIGIDSVSCNNQLVVIILGTWRTNATVLIVNNVPNENTEQLYNKTRTKK